MSTFAYDLLRQFRLSENRLKRELLGRERGQQRSGMTDTSRSFLKSQMQYRNVRKLLKNSNRAVRITLNSQKSIFYFTALRIRTIIPFLKVYHIAGALETRTEKSTATHRDLEQVAHENCINTP